VIVSLPAPPARLQVLAQEFRYTLSRTTLKSGDAIIELRNAGQDAHDMILRRVGGTRTFVWPTVQPGEVLDKELKLTPGTYRLYCGLANHRALGMQATFVVVKHAPTQSATQGRR
jgi:plastocyanin